MPRFPSKSVKLLWHSKAMAIMIRPRLTALLRTRSNPPFGVMLASDPTLSCGGIRVLRMAQTLVQNILLRGRMDMLSRLVALKILTTLWDGGRVRYGLFFLELHLRVYDPALGPRRRWYFCGKHDQSRYLCGHSSVDGWPRAYHWVFWGSRNLYW